MLYLLIGVLCISLIATFAFIFFSNETEKNAKTTNQDNVKEEKLKPSEPTEDIDTKSPGGLDKGSNSITKANKKDKSIINPESNSIIQPDMPNTPIISPNGSWSGGNPRNNNYTATASFTEDNGKIEGQIVWKLIRTKNPKYINNIGTSAVEYVQGTFNSKTRQVLLKGYKKEDFNNIIKLNRYNLSLAKDNRTMSGKSINGKFILKR